VPVNTWPSSTVDTDRPCGLWPDPAVPSPPSGRAESIERTQNTVQQRGNTRERHRYDWNFQSQPFRLSTNQSMSYNRDHQQSTTSSPKHATAAYNLSTPRSFDTMSSTTSDTSFLTRKQIQSTQIPKAWVSPLCGAGAGLASGIATCPLDVIKTKLQAQGGFATRKDGSVPGKVLYRGIIGTGRTIFREEGLRGMYRGLGPMLLGYLPTWAVYLSIYENTREFYYEKTDNWWLARCYSSLTAGACSTVLTNPIWVIKTRLMSQSVKSASDGMRAPWHYDSTWDAARKMYQVEGARSFYSGLTPALLGLTHVAVQFPLYEYFKTKFTGYGMGEHPAEDSGSNWIGISAATFFSKICASTATYPHEVLRTRLQTQQRRNGKSVGHASSDGMAPVKEKYKGILTTCRVILQEEGWRAFYAGIGTNLVRAVPAAMVTMLTYEYLQKLIHHSQDEGERFLKQHEGYLG